MGCPHNHQMPSTTATLSVIPERLYRESRVFNILRDEALGTFKDQTGRPLDWFVEEAKKQKLADHPQGLRSERSKTAGKSGRKE